MIECTPTARVEEGDLTTEVPLKNTRLAVLVLIAFVVSLYLLLS